MIAEPASALTDIQIQSLGEIFTLVRYASDTRVCLAHSSSRLRGPFPISRHGLSIQQLDSPSAGTARSCCSSTRQGKLMCRLVYLLAYLCGGARCIRAPHRILVVIKSGYLDHNRRHPLYHPQSAPGEDMGQRRDLHGFDQGRHVCRVGPDILRAALSPLRLTPASSSSDW